jgi:hypothetical protein
VAILEMIKGISGVRAEKILAFDIFCRLAKWRKISRIKIYHNLLFLLWEAVP